MLPELAQLAPALLVLVVLTLVVPKRSWKRLPARLRDTGSGRRFYLTGPPARMGLLADDFVERFLQLARREFWRLLELGVPLYTIAAFAELRGHQRFEALEEDWRSSPSGLLREHLQGRIDAAELERRLRNQGLPLPAAKLHWTPSRRLEMPPMRWRLEWESRSIPDGEEGKGAAAPTVEVRTEPFGSRLQIHLMGRLRLLAGDEDLAPTILKRPVQSFVLLLLLAREARKPGDWITRGALADELSPGLDHEQQRSQLRNRLADIRSSLPPPLLEFLRTDGEYVGVDLEGASLDVRWLKQLAVDAGSAGPLLPPALEDEIEGALPIAGEEFVPGWEEIEVRVTGGRGTAGDLVRELRREMADLHAALLMAMAESSFARRQPAQAVRFLEEGRRRRPDQEAIALKLAEAYEQSGQRRSAAAVREGLGLTEAS